MVCSKCGANIPEGQTICPTCGASVEATPAAAPAQKPQFNLKTAIIAIALVVCLILCILGCAGAFTSPKSVAKKYLQKFLTGDLLGATKQSAFNIKYFYKMAAKDKDTKEALEEEFDTTNYKKIMKQMGEEQKEYYEDTYGENYKVKIKVENVKKLSSKKTKDYVTTYKNLTKSMAEEIKGAKAKKILNADKIKKIYEVKCKVTFKGKEKTETEDRTILCAKIGLKWKVLTSDF